MDIVENSFNIPIGDFLKQPLFCFFANVSADSDPRISPLWYIWEDDSIWIIADTRKSYPDRVEATPETAVAIVDFDKETGLVQHIGFRGTASVEPFDPDRAERIQKKYLGKDMDSWDESRFDDPHEYETENMAIIRFDPETAVARDLSYEPGFDGRETN